MEDGTTRLYEMLKGDEQRERANRLRFKHVADHLGYCWLVDQRLARVDSDEDRARVGFMRAGPDGSREEVADLLAVRQCDHADERLVARLSLTRSFGEIVQGGGQADAGREWLVMCEGGAYFLAAPEDVGLREKWIDLLDECGRMGDVIAGKVADFVEQGLGEEQKES